MSNPISIYNVLYNSMSDADRTALQLDIEKVLVKPIARLQGQLQAEVEKAVSGLYDQLLCNPWPTIVKENSDSYHFLGAIADDIWKEMLKENPNKMSKYSARDLINSFLLNFPEEWQKVCDKNSKERIEQLENALEFERKLNRRDS